jgi:hypothetical protein
MAVHRLRTPTPAPAAATLAERMERLRTDASAVALEHIDAFLGVLSEASSLADQVASGGEAYHIGVREIARRTHKELAPVVLSLMAIRERSL